MADTPSDAYGQMTWKWCKSCVLGLGCPTSWQNYQTTLYK